MEGAMGGGRVGRKVSISVYDDDDGSFSFRTKSIWSLVLSGIVSLSFCSFSLFFSSFHHQFLFFSLFSHLSRVMRGSFPRFSNSPYFYSYLTFFRLCLDNNIFFMFLFFLLLFVLGWDSFIQSAFTGSHMGGVGLL